MCQGEASPPWIWKHTQKCAVPFLLVECKENPCGREPGLASFGAGDRWSWMDFSLKSNRATFLLHFPQDTAPGPAFLCCLNTLEGHTAQALPEMSFETGKSNETCCNEFCELRPAGTEEFLPFLPLPARWGALPPGKFCPALLGSVGQGAGQCLGCKELRVMGSVRLALFGVWHN